MTDDNTQHLANLSNDLTVAIGSQGFNDDNDEDDSENTSLLNSHRRSRSQSNYGIVDISDVTGSCKQANSEKKAGRVLMMKGRPKAEELKKITSLHNTASVNTSKRETTPLKNFNKKNAAQ